jgi:hypothetical protein
MLKYKIQLNGDILFVNTNGIPPPDLKMYDRDNGNAWLFHPRFQSCIHLEYKNKLTECKRLYGAWICNAKKGITTSVTDCNVCISKPDSPRIPLEGVHDIKVQVPR